MLDLTQIIILILSTFILIRAVQIICIILKKIHYRVLISTGALLFTYTNILFLIGVLRVKYQAPDYWFPISLIIFSALIYGIKLKIDSKIFKGNFNELNRETQYYKGYIIIFWITTLAVFFQEYILKNNLLPYF